MTNTPFLRTLIFILCSFMYLPSSMAEEPAAPDSTEPSTGTSSDDSNTGDKEEEPECD